MKQHPEVPHPANLKLRQDLVKYEQGFRGKVAEINDLFASNLAIVLGVVWTIWVFFIVPIVAYFLPAAVQNHIFFFSSGWIQLFALPVLVYVGNKVQKSTDIQSDAFHQALTHIANVEDQNNTLIQQNTELTSEVHQLLKQNTDLTQAVHDALDIPGKKS